jgi:ubiquinone/menaquinone biosynthesis C-methylase UbiE
LSVARRAVPSGKFRAAGAEVMPFEDGSFDGAVFLNFLHHVPEVAMHRALGKAARVVEPARPIVIIEPLAEGSFFSALCTVEDETDVRTAAQEHIRRALQR